MIINKHIRKILVFATILMLISSDISYADMRESVKYTNITIEDDLSQSTIEALCQDSRGYIWIGTNDGLDRYNGSEFKHYKNDKYNENTITNNYIIDVAEDKNGDMWISTSDGISRINPSTDKIKNYGTEEDNGNLSNKGVCQVISINDNRIFASTKDGLNLYDEENDRFVRILDKEDDLPSQYIYSIQQDSNEHIWVSTDKGVAEFDSDLNEVSRYEDTIGNSEVYATYDDLKGHIWVSTFGDGLFRINLDDNSVDNYKDEPSLLSNNTKDVVIDSKDKLWIATDKGLCSFDYEREVFTSYEKESYERDSIVDDKTRCLLKDSSGLIWVGAYSGISIFNPDSDFYHFKARPSDENSLSGSNINGIYKDSEENLWIGTSEDGLNIVSGDVIKHLKKENSNLVSNTVFDVTGFESYVFIGTDEGVSVLERNDDEGYVIKNYTEKDGLPSNRIRSLYVDSKGRLWIGTNRGLAILDLNSEKIVDMTYLFEEMGISDTFIRAIYEDSNGNFYIGCFFEGGLIKLNPDMKEYKIYKNDQNDDESISNNAVRYITQDLNGNILVGTTHGLNILDSATDKFKHYTENDGLINNNIYAILVDRNNDVWMSTNGGISKLSLKDETFNNFTVLDGLQSNEFNGNSCFNSNDGYLYFGGINGFNVIDINNIHMSVFKPRVIFDRFEVNGINTKDIAGKEFASNENNIKVDFFTDDYKNTKKTKYYYRLNGLEDKWNVTDDNSIILANLAPGKYDLEIKMITRHGIESEINSVNFIIKPPFWRSKYAILLYLILIILSLYRYANKVNKLDKLVNERTRELREQMDKNESLFNKVLKLEQNKNIYFVNLSHELRTPLNILSSINQLIKSFTKENTFISGEKLAYYMDVMNRNCNRLLSLINNLIDYAKIENNNYIIDKKSLDIVYLTEETVLDMKDYIEEKGIDLIFDTDVEEKLIECDKLDIERCIINLVSNAVKFTPEGGLIEVILYDLDDKVKISVKDNGAGISEENQKIIFDRFNQGVDANSEQKGGSGLGLTITKQLITLHGGQVYVNSKLGEGSEFVIILPVK